MMEFVKAEACGNDFIIIDRFNSQKLASRNHIGKLAKRFCQRKTSVGADGLLLLERSKRCDFKMRIFNPDGSEVDMCGNGARCIALYAARDKVVSRRKMTIETAAGDLEAEVKKDLVKIKMSLPQDLRLKFDLNIDGQRQNVSYINTGVPHVVCFVQGLDNFGVEKMGRAIRYHPEFRPEGTNADFAEVLRNDRIRIRTYERGVETETLACGTGAVASGIITVYQRKKPQGKYRVKVDTRSGESLNVYFSIKKDIIDNVYLEGKAKIVYRGGIEDV
ncbi:MAG: diaminopimelate epimerase [Candidatus Omnitrophota bacterium]|nr:MAG: diaminopimelate epimerase [Candidatus Omnitrophota bacterium]